MELLTLALFVTCLVCPQLVQSQDVESRSGGVMSGDKTNSEGGGQSRTIYQRHISPHRMMHFGKRPQVQQPPAIPVSPQAYEVYQPGKYPYLLHIELEQGQTLQALPEVYSYDYPQYRSFLPEAQTQQQNFYQQLATNPFAGQRSSRLMTVSDQSPQTSSSSSQTSEGNLDNEMFGSLERAQPSSNEDLQQGSNRISLNTRSNMQSGRGNSNLPKAYISNMLYGRSSSSSMPSFGAFNKKAEPKDNFFMHFGRK